MGKAVNFLTKLFDENRNNATAGPLKKYMEDHFPFLRIKKDGVFKDKSASVKKFLQNHVVSRLSYREGSKYIT